MHMLLVLALALSAALCSSIFSLSNRWAMAHGAVRPLSGSLLVQALSGLLTLGVILIGRVRWHAGARLEMGAVGIIAIAAFTLMMLAFQREDASSVAPLLGLKAVFLAFLEPLLLGGVLGLGAPLGAALSVVGVMLSSQTDRWSLHARDIWRPGVAIMVAAAFLFAVCDLLVKRSLVAWHGDSLGVALYLVTLSGLLAVVLLPFVTRWERVSTPAAVGLPAALRAHPMLLVPILASATTNFLMQFLLFTAFSHYGRVTLPNIVYNTRSVMVVGLAALLVLGGQSTVEDARHRAYAYRALGALATIGAIALALLVR